MILLIFTYFAAVQYTPMIDNNSEIACSIDIFSMDDAKLKTLSEVISNKSSMGILNLLLHNEMTANEIAQKTCMSLQLAKYHVEKMQKIGLVHVSRIGKNSKARDMNYYKSSNLAIIITPSTVAEKARQSKSLKRSFRSMSRFLGMGVASIMAALSLTVTAESRLLEPLKSWYSEFSLPVKISGTGLANSVDESLYMAKTKVDSVVLHPGAGSGTPFLDPYSGMLNFAGAGFAIPMAILAVVGAVLSFVVFNRMIKRCQSVSACEFLGSQGPSE